MFIRHAPLAASLYSLFIQNHYAKSGTLGFLESILKVGGIAILRSNGRRGVSPFNGWRPVPPKPLSWEVRFFGVGVGIEVLAKPIFVRGYTPSMAGMPHARTWRASRCFLHGSGIPRRFLVLLLYLAQNIVEGLCGAGYGVDDF